MELADIIKQRKAKLKSFKDKGIELYAHKFVRSNSVSELIADFKEEQRVCVAGRMTAKRTHGKACFCDLKDQSAKIQIYVRNDIIGEENFSLFQELDIGDFIGVSGTLFKTHTGEITIKVESFTLLSKSLRPMPEKWHGLKDIQLRYRQRYLDLIANEDVKKVFLMRSKIVSCIRSFLDKKGFIEVETPMMHYIPGGAAGKPFETHHNELDMDLYLRIAPELYLKRLLVGGFEKVYEINRSFRNEGTSTRHNPEFTMLEIYSAYDNYEDMMQLCQELIASCAQEVLGRTRITFSGKDIELVSQWQKRSFAEAVKDKFGIVPEDDVKTMIKKLNEKGRGIKEEKLSRMQIVRIIEEFLQEGQSELPVFFTDYFSILCPLAKNKKDNPLLSERFELFIGGMEVANAYSELNDPVEQKNRFLEEIKEEKDKKALDEDYINALEYGMPPAGGLGIGIDRLAMIFLDQPSIRDVILFPLLRPEKTDE
ncbi:MAG: lysine--tRNA ligase [Candidatus Omnitrophica bacterium]|nr:lysine--tRNA ligase [Candidatus Omnitrophota bacterium]MDD5351922.1 lysine--tRNA ligase [Candidatus Omnitrophota bacterium]MDD5550748.1 lysine--tRNA ligase [Candidatus Omnitrophota bacterium]